MQPEPFEETAEEWGDTWDEGSPYVHFVAERDGRVVGHALLYRRPADLRVPSNSIDLAQAATHPDVRGTGAGRALAAVIPLGARERLPRAGDRLAHDQPVGVPLLAAARVPGDVPAPVPRGSRDARPAARGDPRARGRSRPGRGRARSAAPARADRGRRRSRPDALRFPLSGPPLEALVPPGGRATLLVEPPALPIPGAQRDPRQVALAAASAELARLGVPISRQTILVAGGLARRAGRHELETLLPPDAARRFDGKVEVHDAEDERLAPLASVGARVAHPLVESDVVVCVTAAETLLHGGPAALVAAADASAQRRLTADSLLESGSAPGWRLAVQLERALGARTPLLGVSLALGHPRYGGFLRGFPHEPGAVERRSRDGRPAALRRSPVRPAAAGPPRGAHRAVRRQPSTPGRRRSHTRRPSCALSRRARRSSTSPHAVCIGVPHVTAALPRERPNPLLAAALGLGPRAPPLARCVPGGTGRVRSAGAPVRPPLRPPDPGALPRLLRRSAGRTRRGHAREAEEVAATDLARSPPIATGAPPTRARPFADWDACAPAVARLDAVLVAGCRDAAAARLGFIPVASLRAALDMAHGRAGGSSVGFLVSPPYSPIRVGSGLATHPRSAT